MATKKKSTAKSHYGQVGPSTVPGLTKTAGHKLAKELQSCLHQLNELHLTLKHAHWNVIGQRFISVHEMLDPQVDAVRLMADEVAERMATMGVAPIGTPGHLVASRSWDDYAVGLGQANEHLTALDATYSRVIENHRRVIEPAGETDPITEDLLIGQTAEMEKFQWFIRAHLTHDDGVVDSPAS
ncbi:DNA starvation/stationary phase protection protein [Tessaracoccus terricola]